MADADTNYGNVSDFKTYWNSRNQQTAIVEFSDDEITAALLISSSYIDAAFRSQFMGLKTDGRDQLLEWPRIGVQDIYGYAIPNDVPPREVINATYECAFRQLQTPGIFFKDYTPSKYKSVAISGAVTAVFAIGSAYEFQTQSPQIGAILTPILTGLGMGSFSPLSGASGRS